MDGLSKVGIDVPVTPLPARSPLAEIYSRRSHEEPGRSLPENADPRLEEPVEEGKGLYVDIYA